jgi:hypothetical protein
VAVKLINTDGMALIGPGSEWFWAAITGLILAVTFIAIYRQLRAQQEVATDNSKLLLSQAYYYAMRLGQRPIEVLIDNESLATAVEGGYATPDTISEADWFRASNYMFMQFNSWEYFYYQHRDGTIPEELWNGADAYFVDLIHTKPGLTRFWSEFEPGFAEPFHSYVAQEFAKNTVPAVAAAQG